MRKRIELVILGMLFAAVIISCKEMITHDSAYKVEYRTIIPDSLRNAAANYSLKLVAESVNKDPVRGIDNPPTEIMGKSLEMAKEVYGVPTECIVLGSGIFISYDHCNQEQQQAIQRWRVSEQRHNE